MAELIDREALKEALLERGFYTIIVKHALEKAPTVDAVPIVRCRECKHYDETELFNCEFDFMKIRRPDDFCSFGERKGGDGNG